MASGINILDIQNNYFGYLKMSILLVILIAVTKNYQTAPAVELFESFPHDKNETKQLSNNVVNVEVIHLVDN